MKNTSKKIFVEDQKTLENYKKVYEQKLFELKQKHTLKIQKMKEQIQFFQNLLKRK